MLHDILAVTFLNSFTNQLIPAMSLQEAEEKKKEKETLTPPVRAIPEPFEAVRIARDTFSWAACWSMIKSLS